MVLNCRVIFQSLCLLLVLGSCSSKKKTSTTTETPVAETPAKETKEEQDVTTVTAENSDISDNLDLEAVASLFGECKDLEEFEKKLNDPELKLSNLDLNEDGEVDYLRVVETAESETHVVAIQAIVGDNQYQDVATIEVEKSSDGETTVQVVGDVYMYGDDYIIQPVYASPAPVVIWMYSPYWVVWHSPCYWHRYPPYYHPWHPYPPHVYHSHVRVHVSVHHHYHHTTVRHSSRAVHIHSQTRYNAVEVRQPNKSFEHRNAGVTNKAELNTARTTKTITRTKKTTRC